MKRVNKVSISPIDTDSGELIMERKKMADELNMYFASFFNILDTSNISEAAIKQEMEVREGLRKLQSTREIVAANKSVDKAILETKRRKKQSYTVGES